MDVKNERSEPGLLAQLTQLQKALHRRSTEELLGMRVKAYMALGYIRDHPGATQQELESAMFMDANSIVLMLNELEAARFSVRVRDPKDRRRHIVEITDAGRRAMEKADQARESLEGEVLAPLSPEERAALQKLVRRVLEGLLQPVP
jgi:DNA-binding MarR family transcriptional regulator